MPNEEASFLPPTWSCTDLPPGEFYGMSEVQIAVVVSTIVLLIIIGGIACFVMYVKSREAKMSAAGPKGTTYEVNEASSAGPQGVSSGSIA